MPKLTKRTTQDPKHPEFMAVGPHSWGKGKTVEEAVKNCRPGLPRGYSSRKLTIYTCTKDAYTDDYGRVYGLGELVRGEEMRASRVSP